MKTSIFMTFALMCISYSAQASIEGILAKMPCVQSTITPYFEGYTQAYVTMESKSETEIVYLVVSSHAVPEMLGQHRITVNAKTCEFISDYSGGNQPMFIKIK